jgi:hypothetical protein
MDTSSFGGADRAQRGKSVSSYRNTDPGDCAVNGAGSGVTELGREGITTDVD